MFLLQGTLALILSAPTPSDGRGEPNVSDLQPRLDESVQDGATGSEWSWVIAPYVWMFGQDGDVALKGQQADVDVGFDDLLENLDFAFQGHVEAWRGDWGILLDGLYGKLSVEGSAGPVDVDVGVEQWLFELGAIRRVHERSLDGERELCVDLLAGARYTQVDPELDVAGATPKVDKEEGWLDPFIGLRSQLDLTSRLDLSVRGDVGGFDIGNASDFTWNASVLLQWACADHWTLALGYRALDQDFDHGSFEYDVLTSGPIVGLVYR